MSSARTTAQAQASAQAAASARDSANQVVAPANEAIITGGPYQEKDTSAGLAVLVGQTSKSLAEQQAAAAQAKADEAARAAQSAKDLAAQASADAKAATQAAAAAADDAARAARAVTEARTWATKAAGDSGAAQTSADNAGSHATRAWDEATKAGTAAYAAHADATLARDNATEAERDAVSARTTATKAETDAGTARDIAGKAETDATAAEKAAANAQTSAQEAQAAADRAEEQRRKDEEAARQALLVEEHAGGDPLNLDDTHILLVACGDACLADHNEAAGLANQDVIDWIRGEGLDIVFEFIGVNDAKKCFGKGDVKSCLLTAMNLGSLGAGLFNPKKAAEAVSATTKIATRLPKFFAAARAARQVVNESRTLITESRTALSRGPVSLPALARGGGYVNTLLERFQGKPCTVGDPIYKPVDTAHGNRAMGMEACLDKKYLETHSGGAPSVPTPGLQWAGKYAGWMGLRPDGAINRCHLLADVLSGPGDNPANLATCTRQANTYVVGDGRLRETMRDFEVDVTKQIDGGLTVHYTVTPEYSGDRTVPATFVMMAYGTDGSGLLHWSRSAVVPNSFYSPSRQLWRNLGLAEDPNTKLPVPVGSTP
ncbi:DNA/RNA non-specific endonuclease [Embleya sp. NPDC005575]|uniref:DNA/RNA non-specific endonuclease n=1 Tax=Embleya sp. NPDC005575 TaxID=3156892 RepID=UPI0033A85010